MAGTFELVDAPEGGYRVRMLDGTGNLMAVSVTFPTKRAAVQGVAMAREIAGTGLIRDVSHDRRDEPLRQTTFAVPHGHAWSTSVRGTAMRQHKHLHAPTPQSA
ncbi:hypothetical protein [Arthrobacter sp. ISL-30]|uniref:hypothetical protein n=1 Tax=Arthrobacter sp. ISL-30 TaxID=2819109 RepID=UPI0020356364|nr:hypothetical protein [Arthrobacter sp. ISL-30]